MVSLLMGLLKEAVKSDSKGMLRSVPFSQDALYAVAKLATKHDVAHLLAWGLKKNGITVPENLDVDKCVLKAVLRYERLNSEYEKLCSLLEAEGIPFLPLKGSVLRKYYPEPWMRTSCDIDILVQVEDLERATAALIKQGGCEHLGKGSHDVSLLAPGKTHVELHYDLLEDGLANESAAILRTVWETATIREGYGFWHEMPDEMFYFYHIAHMAKHFQEGGGCGIRPFLDLWILDNIPQVDIAARNKLLKQGKLLKFAEGSRKLSKVWFENAEYDQLAQQIEDFILRGEAYGNDENRIIVLQQKKGGRWKYALCKVFVPYDKIKFHYPILQKHRWLTPFYQPVRWCKLLFKGGVTRSIRELQVNATVSQEKVDATVDLFKKLDI